LVREHRSEFNRKAADVVGLYLNPPQNSLVLCVDEKPCIQALECAQGWIRLPTGRALLTGPKQPWPSLPEKKCTASMMRARSSAKSSALKPI
jgi:hypothetical protein